MSSAQAFFSTVGEQGLPMQKNKAQPWKEFFAGPNPSLADSGKLMVDIPSTPSTGSVTAANVRTGSLGGFATGSCTK